MSKFDRRKARARVHRRIRKKISGTGERPRLAVHISNTNVYAQVVDDISGRTLAAASTLDKELGLRGKANRDAAQKVGACIAKRATEANISTVVFDRGGYRYHGRVKALADAAREGGLHL